MAYESTVSRHLEGVAHRLDAEGLQSVGQGRQRGISWDPGVVCQDKRDLLQAAACAEARRRPSQEESLHSLRDHDEWSHQPAMTCTRHDDGNYGKLLTQELRRSMLQHGITSGPFKQKRYGR